VESFISRRRAVSKQKKISDDFVPSIEPSMQLSASFVGAPLPGSTATRVGVPQHRPAPEIGKNTSCCFGSYKRPDSSAHERKDQSAMRILSQDLEHDPASFSDAFDS